jgi:CheY-like chemotaxis protein
MLPTSGSERADVCVLLVEDNPVNQEVAMAMLGCLGCEVETAVDGKEALEALKRRRYDLVLMDCELPRMDGYRATQKVRKMEKTRHLSPIPIVALTAHAVEEDRLHCLAVGMDDYLRKPYSLPQLQCVMERYLAGRLTLSCYRDAQEELGRQGPDIDRSDIIRTDQQAGGRAIGVIDREALERIRQLQKEGSQDVLVRVIRMYLQNTPRLLHDLQEAVNTHDFTELPRVVQRLRSASGTIGAMSLVELCKEIERAARAGQYTDIPAAVAAIEEAYAGVKTVFETELEGAEWQANR